MKILHESRRDGPKDLSIVLVDWSCRESFHLLDHLARQGWPRERFEVIWVEFHDARPAGIERLMADARRAGAPAPLDVHVLLEAPSDVHYHKHLMYNVGIALARGRTVCICDSDAIVGGDFVASIVEALEAAGADTVLHLDEVRNADPRLYPFGDPTPARITGPGVVNWINGRPAGLWDTRDPLHSRNYGACMAAARDALLAVGGADEHADYLGHICGPYEMTFRLINAGQRELWHEHQWLYHAWHPGEAGNGERMGPHDGRHMSTTALAVRETGRVRPLVANPVIERLREGDWRPEVEELVAAAAAPARLAAWRKGRVVPARSPAAPPGGAVGPRLRLPTRLRLGVLLGRLLAGQVRGKVAMRRRQRRPVAGGGANGRSVPGLSHAVKLVRFCRRMTRHDVHLMRQSWRTLKVLRARDHQRIFLYGVGWIARMVRVLSRDCGIEVVAAARWDGFPSDRPWLGRVVGEAALAGRDEPVVIAAGADMDRHFARLVEAGVREDRIWRLG
ncbi:MAG TPA: hypothetical protein VFJ30_19435 [Phycisphaerae bacterium]|nr:hypothetical protein [Phycisphaerae bacterium]